MNKSGIVTVYLNGEHPDGTLHDVLYDSVEQDN